MTKKNPAAVALGRRGGKARAAKLSKEEMSASNRRAAQARWAKSMKRIDTSLARIKEAQTSPEAKLQRKELKKSMAKLEKLSKALPK